MRTRSMMDGEPVCERCVASVTGCLSERIHVDASWRCELVVYWGAEIKA